MNKIFLSLIFVLCLFYGQSIKALPSGPLIPSGYSKMPVVVSGWSLNKLFVYNPSDLVGFKWINNGWVQIPIQIDERDSINADVIYNTSSSLFKYSVHPFKSLQYCDANTWVGNDRNPLMDVNDELVFMVKDAGYPIGNNPNRPAGVDPSSEVEIRVNFFGGTDFAYIYVFKRTNTNLIPSAGKSYVNYQFKLNSGAYKTTYKQSGGFNPEASFVTTPYYHMRFSDRWIQDTLVINQNGSHLNLIDRNRITVPNYACQVTEQSFANGYGAFMTNKSGPVRAIRSYMGGGSEITQRDHFFYESLDLTRTYIRAGALPNLTSTWDYNKNAGLMIYNNNNNQPNVVQYQVGGDVYKGILIDGASSSSTGPDNFSSGTLVWELINSFSGSIYRHHKINTDITNFQSSSLFKDQLASAPCTGDANDWGNSGFSFGAIPCTDPRYSTYKKLELEDWGMYLPLGVKREVVDTLSLGIQYPVTTTTDVNSLAYDYALMPMVMSGSQLPTLNRWYPGEILGFKYQEGVWQQIPIQVDEKEVVEPFMAYNNSTEYYSYASPTYFPILEYCDANTGIGEDLDEYFDSDDELVFMLKDAGSIAAPGLKPIGVNTSISGVQVKVSGQNSQVGYIYLFKKSVGSSLVSSAGKSYVQYHFELESGDTTLNSYNQDTGYYNLERSYIHTPYYSKNYTNRWVENNLLITKGDYTPMNLIDRQRVFILYPDLDREYCGRTENTFAEDEGAFLVNKSGPIRAIRSYMGANSGPYTQQEHLMYESLEIRDMNLRVHPGLADLVYAWDMNPAAGVMVYNNNNNTPTTTVLTEKGINYTGLKIDGVNNETFNAGQMNWELVRSNYGSILRHNTITHNIDSLDQSITSIFKDYLTSPYPTCTGDAFKYGCSGIFLHKTLPNTDTSLDLTEGIHKDFKLRQWNIFLKPETTVNDATIIRGYIDTPPVVNVTVW